MFDNTDNVTRAEARDALDSADKMESAGWRRGVPERWFGAVISALIGSLCAVSTLQDPSAYIVFPILALGIVIAITRQKSGAYGREFPNTKADAWKTALFAAVLLVVFFGSIVIRRTYDIAWVPLVAGLLVALLVYLASEHERRAYLAKGAGGEPK